MKKYSEELIRHPALNEDGKPCEILERVTFERAVLADGALGEPTVINRRFDLRTGERVNRVSETQFVDDISGARLQLQR
jgi:hypothetical protein